MTAVPFDTLELARRLRDQVATKADLMDLEHRLTIRLGAMQAVLVALVAALVKLL
ncbi:MAG: hypothetical protein H7841_11015 [Magnetospirillum sp. WYHS-4]